MKGAKIIYCKYAKKYKLQNKYSNLLSFDTEKLFRENKILTIGLKRVKYLLNQSQA